MEPKYLVNLTTITQSFYKFYSKKFRHTTFLLVFNFCHADWLQFSSHTKLTELSFQCNHNSLEPNVTFNNKTHITGIQWIHSLLHCLLQYNYSLLLTKTTYTVLLNIVWSVMRESRTMTSRGNEGWSLEFTVHVLLYNQLLTVHFWLTLIHLSVCLLWLPSVDWLGLCRSALQQS